jgi:hypothetical protein
MAPVHSVLSLLIFGSRKMSVHRVTTDQFVNEMKKAPHAILVRHEDGIYFELRVRESLDSKEVTVYMSPNMLDVDHGTYEFFLKDMSQVMDDPTVEQNISLVDIS